MATTSAQQQEQYLKIGYIDQPKPPNTSFTPISHSASLDACYQSSLKSSCSGASCRYMAYDESNKDEAEWNCYVGGANQDIDRIMKKTDGVPAYLLPVAGESLELTKYQMITDSIQRNIAKQNKDLELNSALLFCAKNGYSTTSKVDCMKRYQGYQSKIANTKAIDEVNRRKQAEQAQVADVSQREREKRTLLEEKMNNRQKNDELIQIKDRYMTKIDDKIHRATEGIRNLQERYKIGDKISFYMWIAILFFIVIVVAVIAYFGVNMVKAGIAAVSTGVSDVVKNSGESL